MGKRKYLTTNQMAEIVEKYDARKAKGLTHDAIQKEVGIGYGTWKNWKDKLAGINTEVKLHEPDTEYTSAANEQETELPTTFNPGNCLVIVAKISDIPQILRSVQ